VLHSQQVDIVVFNVGLHYSSLPFSRYVEDLEWVAAMFTTSSDEGGGKREEEKDGRGEEKGRKGDGRWKKRLGSARDEGGAPIATADFGASRVIAAGGARRLPMLLFRESGAQHFRRGHYVAGRMERRCWPLDPNNTLKDANIQRNLVMRRIVLDVRRRTPAFWLPFYSLTQPMHDVHRGASDWFHPECVTAKPRTHAALTGHSRVEQSPPGRLPSLAPAACATGAVVSTDCMHWCYTPQMYDAYEDMLVHAISNAGRKGFNLHRRRTSTGGNAPFQPCSWQSCDGG
jgi:hypothetical protein